MLRYDYHDGEGRDIGTYYDDADDRPPPWQLWATIVAAVLAGMFLAYLLS